MRSGRERWAWMVVVEVRQGTLGVDGPAEDEKEKDKEKKEKEEEIGLT